MGFTPSFESAAVSCHPAAVTLHTAKPKKTNDDKFRASRRRCDHQQVKASHTQRKQVLISFPILRKQGAHVMCG